jgi:hypothetical protein
LDNISLRCRRHNQYEAELVFGRHAASRVREERGVQRHDTLRCLIRTPPPAWIGGDLVKGRPPLPAPLTPAPLPQ